MRAAASSASFSSGGERAVRDVVDLASEGVDREQRGAPIRREQPHPGVEARTGVPGDAAAVLVCQLHSAHPHPLRRYVANVERARPRASGLRRAGQHVVVCRCDRIERGAAAADVARDGESGAAAKPADERCALVEHAAGAVDLELHQRPEPWAGRLAAEVFGRDAEAVEVLGGKVDAPGGVILRHVLPVLCELERGANAVGERDPVGSGGSEDVEDELADRVGREVAVPDEVLERPVRGLCLVSPVGLDQPIERPAR